MEAIYRGFLWVTVFGLLGMIGSRNAAGGSLLPDIENFLNGRYPVATAYLTLYDSAGLVVGTQQMDATPLLSSGYVSTGTDILFNGVLTFPDPYPLVAGGADGVLASIHDFSVNSSGSGMAGSDLVSYKVDWVTANQGVSESWQLAVADDFSNGIAYYIYGGNLPQALSYGAASFRLEFATGAVSSTVPLPGSVWLLGSGILGMFGAVLRSRN